MKGDLSNGQKAYREALQKTNFKGPAGDVKIDANRNGVGTTYITEVVKAADGSFYNKVVKQGAQHQPDAGPVGGRVQEDGPRFARRA